MKYATGLGEYSNEDLIQELIIRKALDNEDLNILKTYLEK